MSRIRIAIVTPGTFAVPSGRSSSVELVATEVAERLAERADVTVVGKKTRKQPSREVRQGVRFVRPPAKTYIDKVGRLLARETPDVIQVENRPRYARRLKRRYPDTPVVLSFHSTVFMSKPHISAAALRSCLKAADAVVVNSAFLRERLLAADPSAEPKIVVNHLGVDTGTFTSRWTPEAEAERNDMLGRLGLQGKKIVLYVGRLIPSKGVHHIVRAMPALTTFEPDAVLLVVGSAFYGSDRTTPYVRKLRRLAAIVKPHVRFVPYVPHGEIASWFRLADVVVVPSASREAFGLVNVEAMAAGVPVVATAAGGMTEIIEHGRTGLLADPNRIAEQLVAHVAAVLADPDYARSLGENGQRRVRESFAWTATADRLHELYVRLDGAAREARAARESGEAREAREEDANRA
ncbi:glycosyltransferase family 4 protein [Paenibacillus flagellatus]|uniref:Glycosyltransferase family 1 protein n=1 Tax=Paenibacillus flagellatus TaxID=2211139 RepID=A0A2V5K2T5_9BACL|nr:glycosyltransferase family 4 protein [Paenibacillus flagellatus]PYI52094.1 glycosyltransferase family 1 protein [Paenibacillus flagellatus]